MDKTSKQTLKNKVWFCGKDVCEILVFKDSKDALLTKGKQAYKADLKSLELAGAAPANPVSYHVEKSVYISGPACIN